MATLPADSVLRVERLSSDATLPTRGSAKSAGYDIYSACDCEIAPRSKGLVSTDIIVATPPGWYGRLAPRSSLAWKHHIDVGAGVIDEDYRGAIGVVLFNHSPDVFVVRKGDRVAQMILERYGDFPVAETDRIESTGRGTGGFGSTGV